MAKLTKKDVGLWEHRQAQLDTKGKILRGLILGSRIASGNLDNIEVPQNKIMKYPTREFADKDSGSEGYVKRYSKEGIEAFKRMRFKRFVDNPDREGNSIENFDDKRGLILGRDGDNPMGTYYVEGLRWSTGRTKLAEEIHEAGLSGDNIDNGIYSENNKGLQWDNKIRLEIINPEPGGLDSHIDLPFVPREIEVTPDLKVIPLLSPGRNTGFYHYTGAEDTIEFNIDWLSVTDESKRFAIKACRLLESWAKNDGYTNKPHMIRVIWGQEDVLFQGVKWVIAAAPYSLTNFERAHRQKPKNGDVGDGGVLINTALLPSQAHQTLTLKRVSQSNLTRADIQRLKDPGEYETDILSYSGLDFRKLDN